ncbi:MAG: L-2-hydroxyglutarate oxidase [SAR324 cluster bacterium]
MIATDFLVIGGGVIGISIARELKRKFADQTVTLLEKEAEVAQHASGRNSGVLHAGFYYTADSLKAKFTRQGNIAMHEYCEAKKLKMNPCGKLVVAKDEREVPVLDTLLERGRANGVPLEKISFQDAKKIEPRVKSHRHALWSPSTASVDPLEVTLEMKKDAAAEGVTIRTGVAYLGKRGTTLRTTAGDVQAGYVVNSAGLYADKIALDFGFSEHYRVLPFKGVYLYSNEPAGALRTQVYPVPDLRNPFLGVHFTVTADRHIKIGPTAMPAFWREQYEGWKGFNAAEMADIVWRQAGLMLFAGFDFRRLAYEELRKYQRSHLVSLAAGLLEGVTPERYTQWGRTGIRAQLLDIRTRKLMMDFVFEKDDRSLHILNAVSPGFTCAIPFSRHIVEQIGS